MKANLPLNMQNDFPRRTYQQDREVQLARWRADIVTLEEDLKTAPMNERVEFQEPLMSLKAKLLQAEDQLAKMKDAEGDDWSEIQTIMDDMWQDMEQSLDQVQNNFSGRSFA